MPVIAVTKDAATATMTLTAWFAAAIERVWQLWSDPRQLERWWGPPEFPATVLGHDLVPGGTVAYLTTGAAGDVYRGWWKVRAVDAPRHLEFEDGWADEEGDPNPDLPVTVVRVTLAEASRGGTDMEIVWAFPSTDAMEQIVAMGFEDGLTGSVGQIDDLLLDH